jgi:hypothetical protein
MSLISKELLHGSDSSKAIVEHLGSGENKIKLGNIQISEHPGSDGVELKFHYSIRSRSEAIKNKKMIFSRVIENVTENDMRMLIKTRIERSVGS